MGEPTILHALGKSIELRVPGTSGGEQTRWRYIYGGKPKPGFHPLCTPAGHVLTNYEPTDHVWHRGLWFTIKFINEENFWEERPPYGTQRTPTPPDIAHRPDGTIAIRQVINWVRPERESAVIHEMRAIEYHEPDLDFPAYALDFSFELTFESDALLDRTPFTTWGGYGGLILRGNRNWTQTRILFPDGSTSDRPAPVRAEWCDLSGKLDGGPDLIGGVTIFDHPDNPRHPTPWYGTVGSGHYINAAFLFDEPMSVGAGDVLRLRYRALVHDDMPGCDALNDAYQTYLARSPSHAASEAGA